MVFLDIDPASHIGNCLKSVGWYEWPNLEFIRSLQVDGVYVDAGAHIGTHTLYFALFCPATHVYAFEPCRRWCDTLNRNLAANGITRVTTYHSGLVAKDGDSIPPDAGEIFPAATLDSFHIQGVKLIKIDVESMELAVLEGALETLAAVEHVFVELWPRAVCRERRVDYLGSSVAALLSGYGLAYQGQLPWEDLHYFGRGDRHSQLVDLWRKTHPDRDYPELW